MKKRKYWVRGKNQNEKKSCTVYAFSDTEACFKASKRLCIDVNELTADLTD
jgi:hypothetical protein